MLLIDDDLTVRQSLEQALTLENFLVVGVSNGIEALQEFGKKPIDVVLLDLNLGEESGWDTLEKLKSMRPCLPIILMTGHPEHRARVSADLVETFMEKPLDLPTLFRKLNALTIESAEPAERAS